MFDHGMLPLMLLAYVFVAMHLVAIVGWGALLLYNVLKLRRIPRLEKKEAALFPSDAPLVSILVPARNEASRILERAVRSMAAQDYPNVEVVVVDDRSTDGTFEILAKLVKSDARIRAIRGSTLPAGWAGKPWALEQAKRAAKGSWILATDADIEYAPEAVRAAMSIAFRGRYDAVTLVPAVGAGSFWTRAVMPVAAWMISIVLPIDKTNDPRSSIALGCGGFFLMRREAHDAVGGYDAIRDEVVDDVATARALKSAGRKLRIEGGQELLHTQMYATLGELWHGFSKNAFAGAENSLAIVARNGVTNILATGLPTLAAAVGFVLWLAFDVPGASLVALSGLGAYLAMVAAFVPVYGALGERGEYALLSGVANLIMVAILLNSAYRAVAGLGVVWRGQLVTLRR